MPASATPSRLSCFVAALIVALLIGGDVFGVLTALDWAFLLQLGVGPNALVIAALVAALPAIAAGLWVGREAYRTERLGLDRVDPV